MGIYSKNLSGQNQMVFVGPANVEYTAQTTFNAFVSSATPVEGEIGVFLESGAVRTTLLTAGLRFFVAQKRDGIVRRTNVMVFGDSLSLSRTAYTAPVRQVTAIGYNNTSLDIGFNFTTASQTNTLTYGISVRETTPGNQPFPIQEGYATVNSTTADEYTVLAAIVGQLNGDFDYQRAQPDRFVKAEILSNGVKTNLTNNSTVTNLGVLVASTAHGLSAGNLVELRDVVYKVASVVDANNFRLDRPYQGATEVITAGANAASIAYTSGTTTLGVRFTALYDECTFKVAGNSLLQFDPITALTAWVMGSGSGPAVKELEASEGIIFDGVGSTLNAPFKADFGQPSLFATTAGTYDMIFLSFMNKVLPYSAVPTQLEQKQISRIVLAVPSSGTTPNNELQTIFGV